MLPFAQEALDGGLVLTIAKQAPTVDALLVMVWYFLRFLKDESVRREKTDEIKAAALTTLGTNCHEFQRDLASVTRSVLDKVAVSMDRNTEALGANTEMMGRVTNLIEQLENSNPPRQTKRAT